MFSLFWNRPVYHHYVYDPFWLHQRQYQRARYLNYLENQIASLFNDESNDELLDFYPEPKSSKSLPSSDEIDKVDKPMKSAECEKSDGLDESEKSKKSEQQSEIATKSEKVEDTPKSNSEKQVPTGRRYQYFSSRTFNGGDYVSEHRERVVSSNGEVHVRSRRQLGNQWHEVETHTNSEGKNEERETWHNVRDDEIEQFKADWCQRHQSPGNCLDERKGPKPESLKDSSDESSQPVKHD